MSNQLDLVGSLPYSLLRQGKVQHSDVGSLRIVRRKTSRSTTTVQTTMMCCCWALKRSKKQGHIAFCLCI